MMDVLRQPRQRFWLTCICIFVIAECADRVALLMIAVNRSNNSLASALLTLPAGLLNDTAIAVLLGLPFLVALHLLPGLWRWSMARVLASLVFFVLLIVPVFDQIADVTFWDEFDSRFNSIAVNYLIYPREVIGNIHESYDVRILLLAPLGAAILFLILFKYFRAALSAPWNGKESARVLVWAGTAGLLASCIVWKGPLAIGDNRELNDIAANGVERFLNAAFTSDQTYDGLYPNIEETEALSIVRNEVTQDNTSFLDPLTMRSIRRHVAPDIAAPKLLNVVLIIEESFGSVYANSIDNHNAEVISPQLDRLAADGLLFTNIYATGNRTVNALEAILTSFPPIPGISTVRRPGSIGMYSLPALLHDKGYETAFLYGGRKIFDNMGTYWNGIGFDHVWDQTDISNPAFTTIWGVADEYLFNEALNRIDDLSKMKEEKIKPFFLSLLTVSNHRPYLYPENRIKKEPREKRRQNAATYADWAFGQFMETARSKPWFKDTVFIFIGDHGPRVFGASQVPLTSFRVPLLFYAPAHIAPERNPVVGSSLDVTPTLLGLIGIEYDSPFFGIDLRRVASNKGRILAQHNFSIAYGDGNEAAVIAPGMREYGYAMKPGPYEMIKLPSLPDSLLDRDIAVTQTAYRMFYAHQYHRGD